MKKDRTMKKVLGGFLIGGMLISGTGLALAGNESVGQTLGPKLMNCFRGSRMGMMNDQVAKSVLDALVTAGTITQEQADKITALKAEREADSETRQSAARGLTAEERQAQRTKNQPKTVGILEQLTTDGTITEEQADAIRAGVREKQQEEGQAAIAKSLTALVDKGVISQGQSDTIQARITAVSRARQADLESRVSMTAEEREAKRDKIQNMTAEERQAYMQANRPSFENPVDQLVKDGTLTVEQADQVKQAIGPMHGGIGMKRGPNSMGAGMRGHGPQFKVSQ